MSLKYTSFPSLPFPIGSFSKSISTWCKCIHIGGQNTRAYPLAVAPEKKGINQVNHCLQCRQGHRPQPEEGRQDNWPEPMHEFVLRSSCCQRVLQQQWCLKSMPRKWDLIFWSLIEHEKIRHMWLVSKYEVTVVSNCLSNIFIKLPRVTNACCAAISN